MQFHSRLRAYSLLAAAAGMALSGPAWGQVNNSGTFKTGDELYEVCTSSDDNDLAVCDWFIMGVHDAIILHQDLELVDKTVCIPVGTLAGDLRSVVIAHMESSDSMSYTAVSLAYNAIADAFPCEASKK